MSFIVWIAAIFFVYKAAGDWFFQLFDFVARRKYFNLALNIILPALCVLFVYETDDAIRKMSDPYVATGIRTAYLAGLISIVLIAHRMKTSQGLTWQDDKRRRETGRQIRLHMALVTGALVFSIPFYWLITTSLKPDERSQQFPPDLIPMQQSEVKIDSRDRKVYFHGEGEDKIKVAKLAELEDGVFKVRVLDGSDDEVLVDGSKLVPDLHFVLLWENYSDAISFLPEEYRGGLMPLWNTVLVTALNIFGTIFSSSLVAFAFARLRWPGRDVLFIVMLATMMVPAAVTMLPVFLIFRYLGWIDTLYPLWVPAFFGVGFNIFLLRQFFMTIPNDLEDAAKIDGCGYFTIYWRIMLPLIKPALAALTIFAFMASWNDFMRPLIYLSSPEKMTLAYALQLFQGAYGGEPGMMMASATMVMLPVLAVFFFTQRYMIQGVTLTGMKG